MDSLVCRAAVGPRAPRRSSRATDRCAWPSRASYRERRGMIAIAANYGWPEPPEETDDETILARLLALNLERAQSHPRAGIDHSAARSSLTERTPIDRNRWRLCTRLLRMIAASGG